MSSSIATLLAQERVHLSDADQSEQNGNSYDRRERLLRFYSAKAPEKVCFETHNEYATGTIVPWVQVLDVSCCFRLLCDDLAIVVSVVLSDSFCCFDCLPGFGSRLHLGEVSRP